MGSSSYTQTIDPASNRQTASTGPTPTTNSYDAAGNQTGDGTTTYSYSDRGRLASVTKAGTTTSYLYNGLGQRIIKQGTNVPSGATRYAYDAAGHLIGEYDQAGTPIQETVYLGDTPVATIKNQTAYYVYADQIDTPRVITDTNNLMVWRWDQADPFGAAAPDENPTNLGAFTYNLRFPGQIYDAESGKHYNVNRDYDPAGGRYIQSDPIGLNGGQPSTFAYVDGKPTSNVDPLGLAMSGTEILGYKSCNAQQAQECRATCGNRGVDKCTVRVTRKIVGVSGEGKPRYKNEEDPQCSCNDEDSNCATDPKSAFDKFMRGLTKPGWRNSGGTGVPEIDDATGDSSSKGSSMIPGGGGFPRFPIPVPIR